MTFDLELAKKDFEALGYDTDILEAIWMYPKERDRYTRQMGFDPYYYGSTQPKPAEGELKNESCYIATCVYGSYDCPEVWTLRRFRDETLGGSFLGRLFIRSYYATAPKAVKWFGNSAWFHRFSRTKLDRLVTSLRERGVADTPYEDRDWRR